MQVLVNVLVVLDTLILGFGVYMVVTAKSVGETRAKKDSVKSKNPVKAAFEFEVEKLPKAKWQTKSKTKKTNRSTTKKVSR